MSRKSSSGWRKNALKPGLVDTHVHLDDVQPWRDAVSEAVAAGVDALIAMGTDVASTRAAIAMAEADAHVYAAAGHHPLNQAEPDWDELRRLATHPRVVAVGEVGLDRADEHAGPWDAQQRWFGDACALALEAGLPVCVHIRDTAAAVAEVIAAHPGLTGVIHYWSLEPEWAHRFLDLGMHISFAGTITRATKQHIRDVAAVVPEDRLLLETDAPWGSPRGRPAPMRPAWIVDTAAALGAVRGWSPERTAEVTTANARALFRRLR